MKLDIKDKVLESAFPPPPIKGSELLVPIKTWLEMYHETQLTGVEFDEFWYESVNEGAAYFFKWLGNPRSTVLVVWEKAGPTHIECRTFGDVPVSDNEANPIRAEIVKLFCKAGFWLEEWIN